MRLGDIIEFSRESWNQTNIFYNIFPYIEISSVSLMTNEFTVTETQVANAPSRAKRIVRTGDILVSTTRPHRGAITIVRCESDEVLIASTGFSVLRTMLVKEVQRDFLLWTLLSDCVLQQMLQRSSGGNYPAIIQDELAEVIIPLLPYDKQTKIVSEIEAAATRRVSTINKAEELLTEMDEVVTQVLQLPDIKYSSYIATSTTLKTLKTDNTISAEFYHPERIAVIKALQMSNHFSLEKLVNISDFIRDKVQSSESDKPYLGLSGVISNTGELSGVEEEVNGEAFAYQSGDVLYGRLRPYLNKVLYAENSGICSTEFHILRVNRNDVLPEYLAAVMRSSLVVRQTKHMMTGNTHPRISNEDMRNLRIPIPDMETQKRIAEELYRRKIKVLKLKGQAIKDWENARTQFENELLEG